MNCQTGNPHNPAKSQRGPPSSPVPQRAHRPKRCAGSGCLKRAQGAGHFIHPPQQDPFDTSHLDVLQPYIDDLTRRNEHGARRAAADIAIAVLLGLYECRDDAHEDTLLARMGLPGAADDLARIVYTKLKPLHLSLPSLADECPKWEWYEES
jgi:hypothetical protein